MKLGSTCLAAFAVLVPLVAASAGNAGASAEITACAQVVTTDAVLTADLTCPGQSGVTVGAAGITIDLNGHTVRGDRTIGHFGIDDTAGFDQVTIENGSLRNFDDGVAAFNADGISLANLVAAGNFDDGLAVVGGSASVKSSTVAANRLNGVHVVGNEAEVQSADAFGNLEAGIVVQGDSAEIKRSTAAGNANTGIFVDGDAAVLAANRAEGNGFAGGASDGIGEGIDVANFVTPPKGKNVARGNDDPVDCDPAAICVAASKAKGRGTAITACSQVVTTNAFLAENLTCPGRSGMVVGADGITIDLNGHTLRGNRTGGTFGVDDNRGFGRLTIKNGVLLDFDFGVAAPNAGQVTLSNLVAAGNIDDGFLVFGEVPSVSSSTATGNGFYGFDIAGSSAAIATSTAAANLRAGFNIRGSSARIQSSIASGNANAGILVDGSGATIRGNEAEANGFSGGASDLLGLGISVTGFQVPPKGRNVARGNDDPAECNPGPLCRA